MMKKGTKQNKTKLLISHLPPPPPPLKSKLVLLFLFIFLSLSFFHCTSPTAPTDNHCTTEELIERLQENPPSLNDCSPLSIRGANMADIRNAGINKQQLLAVWSTNADNGFTPAQLIVAGISIAEMQSNNITLSQMYNGGVSITYLLGTRLTISQLLAGGVPYYAIFNEACNIPLSKGSPPAPVIRLLSTNLSPTNTQVVLEGRGMGSIRWQISGIGTATFSTSSDINASKMLGDATAVLIRKEEFFLFLL